MMTIIKEKYFMVDMTNTQTYQQNTLQDFSTKQHVVNLKITQ